MQRARQLAPYAAAIAIVVAILAVRACVTPTQFERLGPGFGIANDPPGSVVHAGTLYVARGGPLNIGFASVGTARVTVGATEVRGTGVKKERVIIDAGPVAIRVAAAPSANVRLVWNPVGRRGDMEYVPVSSLSPDPPAKAVFGSSVGAAPLDGVFGLGILLVIVGTCCWAARARLRAITKETWVALGAVLAIALLARLWNLGGMGETWDEGVNWGAGRNYVTNVLALDAAQRWWAWNFEHPPVMKYLVGIGAQFADGYGPARAMSAVMSALGCMFVVAIGARLWSLRAGVVAGVIAALSPTLVAHGQIVGHETPTFLWWTLGIVLALGVHDRLTAAPAAAEAAAEAAADSRRRLILRLAAVGAVVGIAVASRFVSGLLGPLVAGIVVLRAPPAWRIFTTKWGAIVMPLVAVLTVVALWPRLWGHPIEALSQSLAKLDTLHVEEPFLGISTNRPGAHYFLVYLYATAPLGALLGTALFAWRAIAKRELVPSLVALGLFVFPLVVSFSPVKQDGVRYVIPSVVALCLLAGAGFEYAASRLPRFPRAALAIPILYFAIVLFRIHPYGLNYFGEQTGGGARVERTRSYETAWWGEGLAEALAYVDAHAGPNARVYRDCVVPNHLAWLRSDLWKDVPHDPTKAAWIVHYAPATTKCHIPKDAKLVYEVDAGGAILARVYRR